MKFKLRLVRSLLFASLAAWLATGCSKEAKRSRYYQQAEAHFLKGDYDRAEIEYLNLLRLEPTNHVALRNLGLMSLEQGRIARAFALLSEAKKFSPEDPEVRLKLAQVLLAGGKSREARDEAVLLLARQPTNENALLLLVESSLTTNDLKDAELRLTNLKSVCDGVPAYHVAWASTQLRHRDLKAAETSVRQALALDPQSALVHGALANLLVLKNDPTNALAEFKAAANLAPPRSVHRLRYVDFKLLAGEVDATRELLGQMVKQTPDCLPVWMRIAQLALGERRLADCEGALKSILARDSTHLEAILLMARLHLAQEHPDKAIAVLEGAMKMYPRVPQLHLQLAVARLAQGDLSGAAKGLNDALAIQPDYLEATMLLAELNIRRGDSSLAINALTKLVERRPELVQPQLLLAAAHRTAGRLEPALRIYEQLSRSFPTNPQPTFMMGLVQRQQRRPAEARSSFEKALGSTPDFFPALEQLVYLDAEERQFAAARQRAQQEIDRQPTNAAPYVLLARVLLAETNHAAGETTLLKALEVAPGNGAANSLLAQLYVLQRKEKEAMRKLEEMVARNTNDVFAWMMIAELNSAASNHTAAAAAYESLLAANPRYGPALNNLAWLYSEHLEKPARAYELASRARELLPRDPSTADTFGWVLYHLGDYPRALALVQESSRRLPEQPEVLYHLGMTHYAMGEEAAARVALQNAIQLAPTDARWKPAAQQALRVLDFNPATADAAAIAELESLADHSPRDPLLLTRLAAVAESRSEWSRAASTYEKALQINTNLVPVLVQLAKLYSLHPKDSTRAFALARRARILEPSDPGIAHTLGRLAYDSAQSAADFQWAFGLLDEAARSAADNLDWQFDLALAAYAMGDVPVAISAMQKVAAANPPSPRNAEAAEFLEFNRLAANPSAAAAAAGSVAAVLAKQPDNVPALMVTGLVAESRGDYQAARSAFESALKCFPQFAPANKALARLYAKRFNDPQKAYDHASRAREALPRDLEVARLLGGLAYQRGEFPRAVQLLSESAATSPDDAELFFQLGFAQHRLKQTRDCRAALTKALALAPNDPNATEARRILAELK